MKRVAAAAMASLLIGAAAPSERVVEGDGLTTITVNGHALRLTIDPGAQGLPVVAAALAPTLGLKAGGVLGFGVAYRIGKQIVYGHTAVARVGWGAGEPRKQRVGWMSGAATVAGDGAVGPAGLPEPVVRFVLRPARAGERTAALPMTGGGGLFGGWGVLTGTVAVGGAPMVVRIAPRLRLSMATAPAAVGLATAQGGVLTDETARQEIAFGIERPLRIMRLARPLAVGPLMLGRIGVRVTDGAGANTLPQEGDDPSEVVVTGKGKQQPGLLTLGADQLDRCSTVVFDKRRREVRLTCLAD